MERSLASVTGHPGPRENLGQVGIDDSVIVQATRHLNKYWMLLLFSVGLGTIAGLSFVISGAQVPVLSLLCLVAFAGGVLSTWSPCGYSSLSLLRPSGTYSVSSVASWVPAFLAHGFGYLAGGAVLAAPLAFFAWLMPAGGFASGWALAVLGLIGLAYGLHQAGVVRIPYPQRRAQVPHRARMELPMWQTGLLYGWLLGLNFVTYVRTPVLYLVVAAAVLSGNVGIAVLLVLSLNLGRFLPLVVNALPVADWTVQRWMANHDQHALRADAGILLFTGSLLVVWSLA
ncbi:MAG: cytochrome c biogenesis protein CcdA [Gammaproteobacteria bacterium]